MGASWVCCGTRAVGGSGRNVGLGLNRAALIHTPTRAHAERQKRRGQSKRDGERGDTQESAEEKQQQCGSAILTNLDMIARA